MGREVKRVALDFEWPLKKLWEGYVNPNQGPNRCLICDETGLSPDAKRFRDQWYGYVPFDPQSMGSKPFPPTHERFQRMARVNVENDPDFYLQFHNTFDSEIAIEREAVRLADLNNSRWSHHLSQEDVDALWEAGRLQAAFREKPTAAQVNEWSLAGMGHDCIDCHICIEARCKREGVTHICSACEGHGSTWPSEEARTRYESWDRSEPPEGDGWQMWETTSDGSPISPVFATPEELATWLASTGASAFGKMTATYEQWLGMIRAGWAPSAVASAKGFQSGVEAMGDGL